MQIAGDILGIGRDSGSNFRASGTNIINPVTEEQTKQLYGQAQSGINQQQNFVNALQAQNGLGHQQDVYGNLQAISMGQGPNPAQAALNNATGQNIANQAALMASQRGAQANPGLVARNAATVGANAQQQSAGQASLMQAQQQMNALNQMGNMANQQVATQAQGINSLNNATQNLYGQNLGAIQGVNQANVGMTSNQNNANAEISKGAQQQQGNLVGNIMGAAGSLFGLAEGGPVPSNPATSTVSGPKSNIGKFLTTMGNSMISQPTAVSPNVPLGQNWGTQLGTGIRNMMKPTPSGIIPGESYEIDPTAMAKGGKVPALVSPGERYLPPKEVEAVAKGKKAPIQAGEKIPGKPKVGGAKNSYANDTVPKVLEEGGIVLPRSVTMAKDAPEQAAKFVAAILKQKALKK